MIQNENNIEPKRIGMFKKLWLFYNTAMLKYAKLKFILKEHVYLWFANTPSTGLIWLVLGNPTP